MSFQNFGQHTKSNNHSPLILFDGYCNLCSDSVQLILKYEKKPEYFFLSLQSDKAKEILPESDITNPPESVILIEGERVYKSSSAGFRILKKLKFPCNIFYYGIFLPRFLRDPVYELIAKNRYKWFGKKSKCYVPQEKWEHRFVD